MSDGWIGRWKKECTVDRRAIVTCACSISKLATGLAVVSRAVIDAMTNLDLVALSVSGMRVVGVVGHGVAGFDLARFCRQPVAVQGCARAIWLLV